MTSSTFTCRQQGMVVILQGTLRGILSSGDEGTSYITHHGFCNLKNISPYSIMEFLCISHSTVNFMSIDRRMDKEDVVNEIQWNIIQS